MVHAFVSWVIASDSFVFFLVKEEFIETNKGSEEQKEKKYKKQPTKENYKLRNERHSNPVTPISFFCKIVWDHIHGSGDIVKPQNIQKMRPP